MSKGTIEGFARQRTKFDNRMKSRELKKRLDKVKTKRKNKSLNKALKQAKKAEFNESGAGKVINALKKAGKALAGGDKKASKNVLNRLQNNKEDLFGESQNISIGGSGKDKSMFGKGGGNFPRL